MNVSRDAWLASFHAAETDSGEADGCFATIPPLGSFVPLLLLAGLSAASLLGHGATPITEPASATLPTVPAAPIVAAASVSSLGRVVPAGKAQQVLATASANGIPTAALAAYQRAETVINAADESCNVPWQLIAAIGRVESDHGRTNGNTLNDEGIATPGIYGIALDGSHGTALIRDTDAGQFDADAVYDRAVGPMQFIPSTWSVVGVDADGDAKRNPQDINDAALATAVYLCSGNDSLDSMAGQQAAVYRYNHSTTYVRLVLGVMHSYLAGDYSAVPKATTSAAYFARSTVAPTSQHGTRHDGALPSAPGHHHGPQTTTEAASTDDDSGAAGQPDEPGTSSGDAIPDPVEEPVYVLAAISQTALGSAQAAEACLSSTDPAAFSLETWSQCLAAPVP